MVSVMQTQRETHRETLARKRRRLTFEVEGRVFSEPRLLRKKSSGARSKAGRITWCALLDGQPVKIYECDSEAQAALIMTVAEHPVLGAHFPPCLMRIGAYLVVEWVKGTRVTRRRVRRERDLLLQIAELQAAIHRHAVACAAESGVFAYVRFLWNRLYTYKGILPLESAVQKIQATLDQDMPETDMRVSHPDVTPSNLVVEAKTGIIKIIDNELLTQNRYCLVDLFNTHHSFGPRLGSNLLGPYLSHYQAAGGDLAPLLEHEPFYHALWHLRLIGSLLQAGEIGPAYRQAQAYAKDEIGAHPLVRVARESLR